MIAHQNVGVKAKAVPLLISPQELKVTGVVTSGSKYPLALVTAGDHMIESAGEMNTGLACRHRPIP